MVFHSCRGLRSSRLPQNLAQWLIIVSGLESKQKRCTFIFFLWAILNTSSSVIKVQQVEAFIHTCKCIAFKNAEDTKGVKYRLWCVLYFHFGVREYKMSMVREKNPAKLWENTGTQNCSSCLSVVCRRNYSFKSTLVFFLALSSFCLVASSSFLISLCVHSFSPFFT